ncbi:SDR family NAD(P)-dependent oxidoreductase [Thalassospira sp.]|uniref:SDR family NAD(P)-dependent oxidoreductase n=1 Tax=Thalassospira sp. TaxID=1912094 RepID=UPI002734D63D|nr:SDR family NAD(P)-dependent oxidoreductase [Thalassospira sp.]MDP2697544.1 SDR family NAD(P)-dependent oxidoreductase [Thalassospira sp.]
MDRRLLGKTALVFGGGSCAPGWGNGKAASVLLARAGAKVAVVDIHKAAAEETVALILEEGGNAIALGGDITRRDQIDRAVLTCREALGEIDVLLNNVGVVTGGGLEDLTAERWQAAFDVNVTGFFHTCQAVMPAMRKRKSGAVVNIGSIGGARQIGIDYPAYAAAKAALVQLTRSLAVEYAPHGVRVNAVIPGLIDTPLVTASLARLYDGVEISRIIAKRHAQVPMGHMGDAWDVAEAVVFLASDAAKYITGADIPVDGGLSCTTR